MSDDDRIGVGSGLHIFVDLQGIVEFLSRLSDLLALIGDDGQLDGSEAIFVFSQVILQCGDELSNDNGWHHDAGGHLMRLLHSEQEVDDEFVLALQDHGTGCEDAASDVGRHECADGGVPNLLALRGIRAGLVFGVFSHVYTA